MALTTKQSRESESESAALTYFSDKLTGNTCSASGDSNDLVQIVTNGLANSQNPLRVGSTGTFVNVPVYIVESIIPNANEPEFAWELTEYTGRTSDGRTFGRMALLALAKRS
jgi:hypothetical protein